MAEIKITESNFEAEVLKADQPVLLDFLGNLVRTVPDAGSGSCGDRAGV